MDTKIECNDNETVESSKKREKGFESNQEGKYKHGGEENMAFGPFQCFCETLEVPPGRSRDSSASGWPHNEKPGEYSGARMQPSQKKENDLKDSQVCQNKRNSCG
jgi:hypothetical protein